jgi:predicted transcriptional regulator
VWHGRRGEARCVKARSGNVRFGRLGERRDIMVYQWKTIANIKADANEAGRQFEQLERTVGVTPQTVLDANRAEDTPLHNEFEWDDDIAAENYRLHQAGQLIRMLCVKPTTETKDSTPIRAYIRMEDSYENIGVVVSVKEKRELMLERAKNELRAFKAKYNTLKELKPVFDAIEEV